MKLNRQKAIEIIERRSKGRRRKISSESFVFSALKKRLGKFIMVVKHKETGDVKVLTKQDVLDRFQSHLECDSLLSFQEVFSHYNYEIRYSGEFFVLCN